MAKSEIVIRLPADVVFAYLADFRRHGEWATHPGLVIEPETEGPLEAGVRLRSHGRQLGRDIDDTLTITAVSAPVLLAFEARGRFGAWRHSFELDSDDRGWTRVTKRMDVLDPSLPLRLISSLVSVALSRRLHRDLAGIRARIEARSDNK